MNEIYIRVLLESYYAKDKLYDVVLLGLICNWHHHRLPDINHRMCPHYSNTYQRISNRNSSDFQEAQTAQTNIQVDFFSEVESTGTKITKNGAGCQGKEP